MEYAADGQFVDSPSLFAANRDARWDNAKISNIGAKTAIDTGFIRLVYTPDGKSFSTSNLYALIKNPKGETSWEPGLKDPQNLGGTIRTLDSSDGPEDLGNGIISRSGWALVDDSQSPLLTTDWVQSRPNKNNIDWYIFGYGDDYRAALKSFTTISGNVPMPRRYTLGTWYSRYWPFSSSDYRQIIHEYSQHNFPLDNIVLDMDWHKDGWTGWSWNRALLPDAEDLLKWFHQQGLHVTLNLHPADGVAPHEDQYSSFMQAMGEDPTTQKTIPFDAGSKKYTDALFSTVINPLSKEGVDFWWLDWQQYPNTLSIPDLTNLFWLNTLFFQETGQDGLRGVSFSRWAGLGDQRHPIHFSGDASTSFNMLSFEVPFTSTAGNVGCFFWSHDIGGHNRGRNEESYTRWCQFGAMSAALRSHSTRDAQTDRRPWNYPIWAEDSMRISFHLRSELFPYIYTSSAQSTSQSVPLVRPMYIDYPDTEIAYHSAQQYLYGDNLLVAPITSQGKGPGKIAAQTVWFPENSTWWNWFTGERIEGGSNLLQADDINEFPLYARGGTPIPMQPYQSRMATAPLSTLVLRCYPGENGKTGWSRLYEDDGTTTAYTKGAFSTTALSYTRKGDLTTIEIYPTKGEFNCQLSERAYQVALPDTSEIVSASVNGAPARHRYNSSTYTNTIDIAPLSIRDKVVLRVNAKPAGWDILHAAAVSRRLSGVLGHPVSESDPNQIIGSTEYASLDPDLQKAVLSIFGVGLIAHNEAPYLYQGAITQTIYAPTKLLSSFTVSSGSGAGPETPITVESSKNGVTPISTRSDLVGDIHIQGKISGADIDFSFPNYPLNHDDLAQLAVASVSSSSNGRGAAPINDGSLVGYPANDSTEWASNKEKEGAWAKLTWSNPQTIDLVALFDRPNLNDHVLGGTIEFSDGSKETFGALPNDGQTPLAVKFAPKVVTWMKVTITKVSQETENIGFSEIAAYNTTGK
jgi:alpha-glucosidase (family GH31 glycosyl hydrolase)